MGSQSGHAWSQLYSHPGLSPRRHLPLRWSRLFKTPHQFVACNKFKTRASAVWSEIYFPHDDYLYVFGWELGPPPEFVVLLLAFRCVSHGSTDMPTVHCTPYIAVVVVLQVPQHPDHFP